MTILHITTSGKEISKGPVINYGEGARVQKSSWVGK